MVRWLLGKVYSELPIFLTSFLPSRLKKNVHSEIVNPQLCKTIPSVEEKKRSSISMIKTAVYADKAPKRSPIYNQAIVAIGFVFCSGQLPKSINGQLSVFLSNLPPLFPFMCFSVQELACTHAKR